VRRRPTTAAAFAVALFVVGRLLAFHHEAASRHVTCAEHGEQLDVPSVGIGQDDGCGQAHLVAVDGDGPASHQDCPIARLLRTSTRTSQSPHIHVTTTTVAKVDQVGPVACVHSFDVILNAPKTSPPV
jgi:hypothetical protein